MNQGKPTKHGVYFIRLFESDEILLVKVYFPTTIPAEYVMFGSSRSYPLTDIKEYQEVIFPKE